MKYIMTLLAFAASLIATLAPAGAATLTYTLQGAYSAAFDIDTDALATITDYTDYFEVTGTGTVAGLTGPQIIAFNTSGFDGGLTLGADFDNLWGAQLFTGTTAAPVLRTGTFTLLLGGDPDQQVTLNVAAAVPEPATWAMMLIGFAAVGFAQRRRTRLVSVA